MYPGSFAIIIAGDFNKLNIKLRNFQLKQLVRSPTRGSNILDLVLTNLHIFYDPTSIEILPPPSLCYQITTRTVLKRDTRPSRKTELGRYLNEVDWSLLQNLETCEQKNSFFYDIISNGFNLIMPERKVKFHTNDAPWITEEFKQLIKSRQRAFSSGNSQLFKFYHNKVNRERKLLRAKFFATKVSNLWKTKPKTWWSNIKRISGMKTSNTDLQSQLQIENTDHLSSSELANLINGTFLEAMNIHHPLRNEDLFTLHQQIPPDPPSVFKAISSPASVLEKLKKLNPSKAPGNPCVCGNPYISDFQLVEFVLPGRKTPHCLERSKHHSHP